ncbi:MAG: hypothetical protein AAF645_12710 [Myxococcota bacterium]
MPIFRHRMIVAAPLAIVQDFHGSTDALELLTPPPMQVELVRGCTVEEGAVAQFVLKLWPLRIEWHARHEDVSDHGFTDVQQAGPLAHWRHMHRFTPVDETNTEVVDVVDYAHPPGAAGLRTRLLFGVPQLYGLFSYRAFQTKRICAARHSAERNARRLRRRSTIAVA